MLGLILMPHGLQIATDLLVALAVAVRPGRFVDTLSRDTVDWKDE